MSEQGKNEHPKRPHGQEHARPGQSQPRPEQPRRPVRDEFKKNR